MTPRQIRTWPIFAVICGLATLNYVDRMLLAVALPLIKKDFSLSDTALGAFAASFALVYAIGGIPAGRLADLWPRRHLITAAGAVWSLMTAACGIAPNFLSLLAARCGVAISEAAYMPAAFSLMSDLFSPRRRNFFISLFMVSCSTGIILGLALGGWLINRYGWRASFTSIGVASLLIVAGCSLVLREPPRGAQDAHDEPSPQAFTRAQGVRRLWTDKVFLWCVLSSGLLGYTTGIVQWLPTYFQRTYHLPMSTIGLLLGPTIGVGLAAGQLISGVISHKLAARGVFEPLRIAIVSAVAQLAGFLGLFFSPTYQAAIGCTIFATLTSALASPVLASAVQNASPSRLRGMAHAWLTLSLSVFGLGLGPMAVGMLSDALAPRLGDTESLRAALLCSLVVIVLGGLTACLAFAAARRRPASG